MIYKAIIFRRDLATSQQPFLPKIEWLESITCYHVCTNELSLPYVVKFVALVWFNVRKTMSKEVDNNVQQQATMRLKFPKKIPNFWAVLHIKFHLKRIRVGKSSFLLQKSFFIALCRIFPFNPVSLRSGTIFYGSPYLGCLRLAGILRRNQYDYYNTFLSNKINLSIKYK